MPTNPYGVNLAQNGDGRWHVADLVFRGMAEEAEPDYGDFVTVDGFEQVDGSLKEWVHVPTIVPLTLLLSLQRRRRPRI